MTSASDRHGDGHDRPVLTASRHTLFFILLFSVFVMVVLPVGILIATSVIRGTVGSMGGLGLEHWRTGLSDSRIPKALWNTVWLSVCRQSIAMVLGVTIAWLLAKSDLPGRKVLEVGFWVAYFVPSLTVTLSWIFLADPFNGVLNTALRWLPFIDDHAQGPLNVFSFWGIVWVNLVSSALPIKVMLLTPAFRALDSSYEEAARASGDTAFGAFRRVTVPMLLPTFLIVGILGLIRSFESFESEFILGVPARIEVLSSLVYGYAREEVPPDYGAATVTSMIAIAIMLPLIVFQQRYTAKRTAATVSGKFMNQPRQLGRWRWPIFSALFLLLTVMTVLPLVSLVGGTFMRFFGIFNANDVWTTEHWHDVLGSPLFTNALGNSIKLAVAAALLGVVWFFTTAYVIVRTKYRGRAALDFLSWAPTVVPGVVLGLGYLWVFLLIPGLREIYGTMWSLILVTALGSMTVGVQLGKQSLRQLGNELEEASWASGATRLYTIRKIVLPLVSPALVVIAVTTFAAAARTTSHVALLSTSGNQPLAILQLNQMAEGQYEGAAVVGVFQVLLSVGVAVLARTFGYKNE